MFLYSFGLYTQMNIKTTLHNSINQHITFFEVKKIPHLKTIVEYKNKTFL